MFHMNFVRITVLDCSLFDFLSSSNHSYFVQMTVFIACHGNKEAQLSIKP